MKNLRRFVAASFATALLVGCGAPSPEPVRVATSGCPAGRWDAAIIWSSETASGSQLDYVDHDAVVASQTLPYLGIHPAPRGLSYSPGSGAWLPSNGNTTRDRTHVLHWSQTDCSLHAYRVSAQVIWSVTANDEAFYTTNTLNATAEVRRRTLDGQLSAEAHVPSTVLSNLTLDGDRLYAVGDTGEPGTEQTVLITFDATTLTEASRLILGPDSTPVSTLIHDGTLYLPGGATNNPDGSGQEVSTVVTVDLATNTPHTIDLGADSPYLVTASERGLIFAHTFMNPTFRDMNAYGDVTLLDPQSGATSTLDLGPGLRGISVAGDTLLVLTREEGGPARLTRYALGDMSKRSTVEVAPPAGGHYYLSGILVNQPSP